MPFSTTFPGYHPRAGEPTFFREKIWAFLADTIPDFKIPDYITDWDWHEYYNAKPKLHTIRAGHRWKVGDWFSPRVWGTDINPKNGRSGPYHSKQIIIAPDMQVKKVWDFEIVDKKVYCNGSEMAADTVGECARNDGLSFVDFLCWFKYPAPFDGQIIAWDESIEY